MTDQINAGCYVFRRAVLESIPAGRPVSVERETFPGLLADGAIVLGHVDSTYWLDLGTPAAFVRGSADLVLGVAPTAALPGPTGAGAGAARRRGRRRRGGVRRQSTVGAGAAVGARRAAGRRGALRRREGRRPGPR